MTNDVYYALQPFWILLMWFLIGLWVWRNDD